MNIAHPFIYGRTKSVDYHWLQPPKHPLRIDFFANFLESCNHLITRGEQFYFVGLDERVSIFSIALSLPRVCDRRGRPIAFIFGYTVERSAVREFAFRLPGLLQASDSLLAHYDPLVRNAVETDGSICIQSFNPFILKCLNAKHNRASDQWVDKTANEISLRIDTPKIISNIDVSQLGLFINLPGEVRQHVVPREKIVITEPTKTNHQYTKRTKLEKLEILISKLWRGKK